MWGVSHMLNTFILLPPAIGKGHMGNISDGKKSHICSYDKTTGKVTKLAEDEYGGKLYYSGDAI